MKRLYLEDNRYAEAATKECHQEAQRKGFDDWYEWEKTDKDQATQVLFSVTRKYREMKQEDELR